MTKNKYFVELPNGEVATRTSARTYTHAVVVAVDEAWDRDRALDEAATQRDYAAMYSAPGYAEKYAREAVDRFPTLNLDYDAEVADVKGWAVKSLAEAEELEAKAAQMVPGRLNYHVAGWCGRYDLAVKLAAQQNHRYWTATIVEAQVK
jgi:hypothetical protein